MKPYVAIKNASNSVGMRYDRIGKEGKGVKEMICVADYYKRKRL